jgi:PAS domain S-box-containing protein
MKQEMKSIALLDDRSQVSNYIKLHFQNTPGFSVTRVYSREELDHNLRKTPVDFIVAPAGNLFHGYPPGQDGNRICLFWSIAGIPKKTTRSPDYLSFLFEIETPDTSLSYHSSALESLKEQFDALARLLVRIDRYHRDFVRFQADADILQSIVEDTVTGILYLFRNKIHWTNRGALRILGRTEHELVGKEFSSLFPDDPTYREVITLISRNRDACGWGNARSSLLRGSGDMVDCTIRMRRRNPMNSQKGHLVLIEDDKERVYLEQAVGRYQENMAKYEMKYLEILQRMDQVIIKTDPNGAISFWNDRAERTFGYKAGEVAGKHIVAVTTDTGSRAAKDMAVLLYDPAPASGSVALHIIEHRKQGGEHLWAAWNTLTCRDVSGTTAGIVWIGQDISDIDPSGSLSAKPATWKHQLMEGTGVKEEVFDKILHTAIELGRGGRESRKIGTSFVIGDSEKVLLHSRQASINSFEGKEKEQRMVQDWGTIENIKNLSLLDGAFVIDGSGFIHASSRHLLADVKDIDIPQGFGTRHASVAAMTKITRSIGIVVSESGGTITIFRDGTMVKQIQP